MEWTIKQLIEFIVEASSNTYANPAAKTLDVPYRPGCEEFLYESGPWKYLDSYAWKRDGGGEEIVYFKGTPVWLLNYYGFVLTDVDTKALYAFLHKALAEQHPTLPVRGAAYTDEAQGFRYEVDYDQDQIRNLRGVERIYQHDALVYECYLHGGFVR